MATRRKNHDPPDNATNRQRPPQGPPPSDLFSLCQDEVRFVEGDPGSEVHVLSNEARMFTARGLVTALEPGADHGMVQRYLREFAPDLPGALSIPVPFRIQGTQFVAHGYHARVLTAIIRGVLLRAAEGTLRANQQRILRRCQLLSGALLDLAIEDLIDSVTGYDQMRAARDSERRVQQFVREGRSRWQRRFPSAVFDGYADLEGTTHDPQHRPLRWGKYNLDFIYRPAFGADVVNRLKDLSPNPHHRNNLHQYLTGEGEQVLDRQISAILTVQMLSRDMGHFRRQFNRLYRGIPEQLSFEDRDS